MNGVDTPRSRDVLNCGAGPDKVVGDHQDEVDRDCEIPEQFVVGPEVLGIRGAAVYASGKRSFVELGCDWLVPCRHPCPLGGQAHRALLVRSGVESPSGADRKGRLQPAARAAQAPRAQAQPDRASDGTTRRPTPRGLVRAARPGRPRAVADRGPGAPDIAPSNGARDVCGSARPRE